MIVQVRASSAILSPAHPGQIAALLRQRASRDQDALLRVLRSAVSRGQARDVQSLWIDDSIALRRFLTQLPARSEPALGDVRLEGALIECDAASGRATRIETFRRQA